MCGSLRCAPADDRVLSASRLGCAPGRGRAPVRGRRRVPRGLLRRSLPFTSAASVHTSWPGSCRLTGRGALRFGTSLQFGAPPSAISLPPGTSLQFGTQPSAISLQPGTYLRFGAASQDTFPPFGDIPYGWGLSCAAPRQGSPKMAGKSQNGGDSAAKACRPAPLQATTIPRRYSREHRRPSPAAVPDQAWSQPVPAGPTAPSPAQPSPAQPGPARPSRAQPSPASQPASQPPAPYFRERIPRARTQASGVMTAISATGFGRKTAGPPSFAA